MPEFAWRAAHADGRLAEGRLQAADAAGALRQLRDRGLTPIRVDDATAANEAEALRLSSKAKAGRGPVNAQDVLNLTTELSIMLRAGLALDSGLRVLIEMSHKPSVKAMLGQMLDDVKGGAAFSKALAAHQPVFNDFYINMVRSGEASGQLSMVLERLVEHMERLRALRENVISAMLYPAILLFVAVASLIGMLAFVVPQFEKLFKNMGDALPMPTRIVMAMGHGFQSYGLILGVAAVLLGWLFSRWIKSPAGKRWWQNLALRLPILGGLLRKYELTLYARSLGTLLGNGVPLLGALQIATETVGNGGLRAGLAKMIAPVKEGGRVAQAMSGTRIFEPLAINLVRVGEETGRIGPMMLELATILNREVEVGIKRALTLLEPILILLLGVLIACIIVSILLGIMSINNLAN
ncbi:type II secretion system protein F [Comamonas serinivorans]|uniref:Type II secretion system protein F n=1 Tax=Comamonas serinivorans TaxID=1082851 RepID=A0A1Y0ERL5_9BURK|nr:type II secretion system F family protein [Comamonas serinivorans]ARU06304.1 type II secretion system protein F [Comamonas serinivorans]